MKQSEQNRSSSLRRPEARIELQGLWKTYGNLSAVRGIDLTVEDGEFCTVLGPSGSGKTTALMMIAGFVLPTRGRILVAGRDLTHAPPQKRDLGVVFQNYALFPHMSVRENIAFPLEMRHMPLSEIGTRIDRILKIVELSEFADRMPRQLSGGQQQRVALARALVFEPGVLLMDEPLGALDKQLRAHLQLELKRLQRRLKVTVVYVTHDQEEALTMADRIVIMRGGIIEQNGTPQEIYERPKTAFVATFIGDTNLLPGTFIEKRFGRAIVEQPTGRRILSPMSESIQLGDKVSASIRPERIVLDSNPASHDDMNCWDGRIRDVTYLGDSVRYHVIADESRTALAQTLVVKEPRAARAAPFDLGDHVYASWPIEHTRVLAIGES